MQAVGSDLPFSAEFGVRLTAVSAGCGVRLTAARAGCGVRLTAARAGCGVSQDDDFRVVSDASQSLELALGPVDSQVRRAHRLCP